MSTPELNPALSEVVCGECEGSGHIPCLNNPKSGINIPKMCSRCFGSGKLDWVENMIGRRRVRFGFGSSSGFNPSFGSTIYVDYFKVGGETWGPPNDN